MTRRIEGSWFEFQHFSRIEGKHWNRACAQFTSEQWEAKVAEAAALGLTHLVLMNVACRSKAFYPSEIYPTFGLACCDPIEAVLNAADRCGIKFFVGAGFFGSLRWGLQKKLLTDPKIEKRRLRAMGELAEKYAHHRSFQGWYWPNEASIQPYFSEEFIGYVQRCNEEARRLTPGLKTLIAPYGTRFAAADDEYAHQLERLDVDFVAYQDEVGVRKTQVEEVPAIYERLRRVHDRVSRTALWADVEIFEFEGRVYFSPLRPAPFERVRRQLEAVSPFVDRILVYQLQGMMNSPGSRAFAGHPDSAMLYQNYREWLRGGARVTE